MATQLQYIAVLGRESVLSFAELSAVITFNGRDQPKRIDDHLALFSYWGDQSNIDGLQYRLGGTIKIAKVIDVIPKQVTLDQIVERLPRYLPNEFFNPPRKIVFSATAIQSAGNGIRNHKLNTVIKEYISAHGANGRFIQGKQYGLSSVQLLGQKVLTKGIELLVVTINEETFIAQTVTAQNYRSWSKRDYDRPAANPYRGMMPPKLARMILNIAVCRHDKKMMKPGLTVLDPFCGEGTILQEALTLQMSIYGSDIDPKAVADTKHNLLWFFQAFLNQQKVSDIEQRIVRADIRDIAMKFPTKSVDFIITEPFLGVPAKNMLTKQEIGSITETYSRLFQSLMAAGQLLQPDGGILAVAAPMVQGSNFSQIMLKKPLLDSCEKFGYTLDDGPYQYSRPDAKIARAIYFFKKGKFEA